MSKTNNGLGVYPGGSFSRSLGYVVMRRKMYRSQVHYHTHLCQPG